MMQKPRVAKAVQGCAEVKYEKSYTTKIQPGKSRSAG